MVDIVLLPWGYNIYFTIHLSSMAAKNRKPNQWSLLEAQADVSLTTRSTGSAVQSRDRVLAGVRAALASFIPVTCVPRTRAVSEWEGSIAPSSLTAV